VVADGRLVRERLRGVVARLIDGHDLVLGTEGIGDLGHDASERGDAGCICDDDIVATCVGDGDLVMGERSPRG